ncbi:short chain dehydrogenase [Microbulbifer flavimaris]|uniref:Short chain dehydrogenase n=1 Tax=Microbulbifer flavimaris TaxID=1781068 RepID=A0ABX4HWD3_9GAMM|nr:MULTISPECIES: NAD(P)H-binding protein [Microbulbifer]KUJ80267.1 NADH dehydrogenase [Microbulbifer sp. ZGT114]PCO04331.1 short chain dehydrogenase [Microbulbifer flavimaris]
MASEALIIGATGLIGTHLTNQLAGSAHFSKVVTLTRRPMPHPSPKVENTVVDFERLQDHAALFHADMLFSCLGTTRRQAGSLAAQRRVDVDYQLEAARLAARAGVEHYLLVSSSGANASSRNAYLKMKGELEDAVSRLPFPRISVFRPSLLLGDRDHVRVGEKLGSWILPAICALPGLRRYRPIRGAQVAEKMLQVSTEKGPAKQVFILDEVFPD